jgi:spore coat polysaccharide biosynthesis predicted glycosyltransferase SpsG/CMP-N-acetylneuraminic acid synthetase
VSTLAIIPAHAGSRALPRQNIRLLGGRPLIAHVIRACKACGRIDRTVVSTEDDEIAVVAQRFGAEVVMRPPALAGDDVTLAPVVFHALQQIEAGGATFDIVATVQANTPLLQPASLERGLALLDDPHVDTVISVRDATCLSWTADQDGTPRPLFTERVNRRFLPPVYAETGGLIASRCNVINANERIGRQVRLLVLDPVEALNIDTCHDWWLAEKVFARRRIAFHVVGSRLTGLGHIHRVLILSRRLTDHEVLCVVAASEDLAASMLAENHLPAHVYQDDPLPLLEQLAPDIVVNDVLDTPAEMVQAMKQRDWRVVNFEDHGPGAEHADAVINALYHDTNPPPHVYTGPDYYCLREEFHTVTRRETPPRVQTLLVCFGGTDPSGLTVKTVRVLRDFPPELRVLVVLGPGFADESQLTAALDQNPQEWEIVRNTRVISHYMEQADLIVTSAGRTLYECATVGVPALVLCQNQRELKHVFASRQHGFINLGLGSAVPDEKLVSELRQLCEDHALRRDLQYHMWEWDGRSGIDRVIRIIVGQYATT